MPPNISVREHIRWLPDQKSEPTSTLVLTSEYHRFVDVRILREEHGSGGTGAAEDVLPVARLDWAFGGVSSSQTGTDSEGKHVILSEWKHWVDSRTCHAEQVKDEGMMYSQSDGRTLEKGSMVNPATGRMTEYEEMWKDIEPVATVTGNVTPSEAERMRVCIVLMLDDEQHEARGMVVRVGQFCQGIIRTGQYFSLERWVWMKNGEKKGDEIERSWRRTSRIGNFWLPCGPAMEAEMGRLKLGGEVNNVVVSRFKVEKYTAEHFVESAGAIISHCKSKRACLLHHLAKGEWLLPKGRRNAHESRQEKVLREVTEEPGFLVSLFSLNIGSRAPSEDVDEDVNYEQVGVREPFMVTARHISDTDVKVIWWYIAEVLEHVVKDTGEVQIEAMPFDLDEARQMLTFEEDRTILQEAVRVYGETMDINQ